MSINKENKKINKKNCIIQTLVESQNCLMKHVTSTDGNHSENTNDDVNTYKCLVKYRNTLKNFKINTRNQFEPQQNITEIS